MIKLINIAITLSLILFFSNSFAAMYKCKNGKNEIAYQQKPCAKKAFGEKIKVTYESKLTSDNIQNNSKKIKVHSLKYAVTEQNSSYWKYAWQFKAINITKEDVYFKVEVLFLDNKGFQVDNDLKFDIHLKPLQRRTISDYEYIDNKVAPKVKKITLELNE